MSGGPGWWHKETLQRQFPRHPYTAHIGRELTHDVQKLRSENYLSIAALNYVGSYKESVYSLSFCLKTKNKRENAIRYFETSGVLVWGWYICKLRMSVVIQVSTQEELKVDKEGKTNSHRQLYTSGGILLLSHK